MNNMEVVMKSIIKSTVAAAALTVTAGAALAEGQLVIYHWFEYIPQELLDKFAAENDVEIIMDTYDSNEALLAALKAGAMGTYDVVTGKGQFDVYPFD